MITVSNKIFTIHTKSTTYQFMADEYDNLIHLYYGRKTDGVMDYLVWKKDSGFSGNPHYVGRDRTYSLDFLPQEFPARGTGDFRSPCFDVRYADTSWGVELHYKSHRILDGKNGLKGLPAVYAGSDEEAQTLEVVLEDAVRHLTVTLLYGVLPQCDVITRSAIVKNTGTDVFTVEKLQPVCVDFTGGDFDLINFYGRHALERNYERTAVTHGARVIGSRRGSPSHQQSPFVILCDHDATERAGTAYGFSFVYSGGFKAEAEKDQYQQTRFQMGLQDEMLSYPVHPGEEFVAPEVIMSCSVQGIQKLSHNFHTVINNNIVRGRFKKQRRPVLINSWEAAYFDFTADTIVELAARAQELGIEMLVMDDGWFGMRSDDNAGLGDWTVNEEKLGSSLGAMVDRINALGMKFGIWFEPEMVNEDSDLYRKHPDYALNFPGRKPVRCRNQLVLDYSRKEVVDEIYTQMCRVLDSANIEYIKWDFNRNLIDVFNSQAENQGTVLYDYVKGVYDLLERLTTRYPHILFEGCSGGGGRFDAGMLYYTPQIWLSDNTDAVDRTYIQYGSSFGFPLSAMGAHVSICPNHQTARTVPMHTRGVVAMAGTFGYELNLAKVSDTEKEEIRKQVAAFKTYAPLIQYGRYYRLTSPFEKPVVAWQIVSEDAKEFLVSYVVKETHGYMPVPLLKLEGLEPGAVYREESTGRTYPADALMESGFPITEITEIYQGDMLHFVRV
ncbi:MAG: alpha-galactosidase [Treponemataceae bacterium]|nr:alpha-galactosidase [Treponemataceae bacterium]